MALLLLIIHLMILMYHLNKIVMFDSLYDVVCWLTSNYSRMPVDFKNRFPEKDLVCLRQNLFNITNM